MSPTCQNKTQSGDDDDDDDDEEICALILAFQTTDRSTRQMYWCHCGGHRRTGVVQGRITDSGREMEQVYWQILQLQSHCPFPST